jgi:hypothetical protein
LGSRHGLVLDPIKRRLRVVRFDTYPSLPAACVAAGAVIHGKRRVFPLGGEGEPFTFVDQRLSPCGIRLIGIDAESALKVTLTLVTPFRPRDPDFSTIPVLGIRLEMEPLAGHYRWHGPVRRPAEAELFFEIGGEGFRFEKTAPDAGDLFFGSTATRQAFPPQGEKRLEEVVPQHDRFVALRGTATAAGFSQPVSTAAPAPACLELAWCTFHDRVFEIFGKRHPFRFARRFSGLDAVADWARAEGASLFENAAKVDAIVASNACSASVNALLAQTLHSWLINTWWIDRDGRDWLSVWEGNCHFHSTVDVEFTQGPFYLALWPELLGMELDFWPEFARDGRLILGEKGAGLRFQSHDVGTGASANGQAYHHDMAIEETANYVILLFLEWRRRGDFDRVCAQRAVLADYLAFIAACDTAGTGIPDQGVANTIDDASPAIQFGRQQTYLAVKCLAAWTAAAAMLRELGEVAGADEALKRADRIRRAVERKGWKGDHYAVLLEPGGKGLRNPWSGAALDLEEIPGWDSAHIYTENALAMLDMVGVDLGLSRKRLATDLRTAARACLREYGCVHTAYSSETVSGTVIPGLVGASLNPGWISMNMLRDMAAFYRGVDLRPLADRYWNWQTTTNAQHPVGFFETFNGNNLHLYPRGVAVWGFFDALAGRVYDAVAGIETFKPPFPETRVPILLDADWKAGTCRMVDSVLHHPRAAGQCQFEG